MGNIEFHPYANLFPMMPDNELQKMSDDIAKNGLHEPILLYENKILDGRLRRAFRICRY